jgi:hypothetical protein
MIDLVPYKGIPDELLQKNSENLRPVMVISLERITIKFGLTQDFVHIYRIE